MAFFIRTERFCETCGRPLDQCECLLPKENDSDDLDFEDEDYL